MKQLKDILLGSLGAVGYAIWFVASALLMYAPLLFLDFPFWIDVVIIIAVTTIPFVGGITEFVIWIWSFVVVISDPIDGWSIFYFVTFAIYFITNILTRAIDIIISLFFNNR